MMGELLDTGGVTSAARKRNRVAKRSREFEREGTYKPWRSRRSRSGEESEDLRHRGGLCELKMEKRGLGEVVVVK